MPKTKDAFAFFSFNGERILQRPYFRRWRAKYHVGDDLSDAAILATVVIYYSDSNVDMCEFDNEKLKDLLTRLEEFQQLIQRHANSVNGRLEQYRRAVYNQISAAENFSLQSRLDRVEEMTRVYLIDAARAAGTLAVEVKKSWQKSEQDLQAVYRRRFGERLKSAREAAGLSRKELGDAVNLLPNSFGLYETGKRDASTATLIRLARKLKVSADWLIGLE